ncbi:MAG: helix-turn-helix domain-containing protein [Candidatus Kapaibacterium sp.]|nr:MAG: helix-turn-helix domain-containing protein [Candidatus Kapabacteria bacterium]
MTIPDGEIFRTARQQRNLTIDEVAKRTKIGVRVIEAIESGNFQALPPTYMRSFVKTYSQFLDVPEPDFSMNEGKIAERFQPKHTEVVSPLSIPENVFTPAYFSDQSARNRRILTIIYSVVGGLIAAAGYLMIAAPKVPTKPDDTMITRPLRIIAETIKPGSTLDSTTLARQVLSDSLVLEARAEESVWLNVVMDKKHSEQITLESGKSYRWSAEKQLSLALGNAGGAVFTLNGRPLAKFGERGEVVRDVRIARDAQRREVIASSNYPTIIRNIDGSLVKQNPPVASDAAPNLATKPATVNTSPPSTPASARPNTSSTAPNNAAPNNAAPNNAAPNNAAPNNAAPNKAASPSIAASLPKTVSSNVAKPDSVKPKPRLVVRRKEPATVIVPVVPNVAPPKPQFGKIQIPAPNPIKNN